MLAAAHVNVHYLLILLLPSVAACAVLAVTWYFRAKRRREAEAKRVSRGTTGDRHPASGAGPRSGSGAKGRPASGTRSRSGSGAKRRK